MYKAKGELNKQDLGALDEVQIQPVAVCQSTTTVASGDVLPPPPGKKPKKRGHILIALCAVLLVAGATTIGLISGGWDGGSIAVDELTSLAITLNVNSQPRQVNTNTATVGELLSEQHIRLTEDDYLGLDLDQPLCDGMTIWLRLSSDITIVAGDKTYTLSSQPITVQQALDQVGLTLSDSDQTSLPLLRYIYTDTNIRVSRVWTDTVTETEDIEPPVVEQEYTYLTPGSREVVSPGRPGVQSSTYEVTYKDGEEISRVLLETKVTREPDNSIVGVGPDTVSVSTGGTELPTATTESGASFYYTKSFTIETTAYTWTGNKTRTGTWPKVGTIAVDPSQIPLGTKAYIVGYGFATAEDTGGAIKGNIVDLYMDTYQECINWGRRDVTIYLLAK